MNYFKYILIINIGLLSFLLNCSAQAITSQEMIALEAKAKQYWILAAAHKNQVAQYNVGKMYQLGLGGPKDTSKAEEYLKQSCSNGYQDGCKAYQELVH